MALFRESAFPANLPPAGLVNGLVLKFADVRPKSQPGGDHEKPRHLKNYPEGGIEDAIPRLDADPADECRAVGGIGDEGKLRDEADRNLNEFGEALVLGVADVRQRERDHGESRDGAGGDEDEAVFAVPPEVMAEGVDVAGHV